MPFHAILVLLLAAGTPGAASPNHPSWETLNPGASGAVKINAFEQSADEKNGEKKQSHAFRKRAKQGVLTHTFTGMVEWEYKPLAWDCDAPNCDHFALYDDAAHANYELDDARRALPFEGKRATVVGVLDTKNSVLHVISISGLK